MPRYIDADALMRSMKSALGSENPSMWSGVSDAKTCFRFAMDFVCTAPTLSPDEVRGVVHCKDCKWCHAGYCEKYDDLIPFGCANKPWEDWFCADGKRREAIKEAQDAD